CSDDIHFRLLRRQRRAGGLRVEPQHQRARIARLETFAHDTRPHSSSSTKLGNLFKQVVMRVEEEGKPGSKIINLQSGFQRGFDVRDSVSDGESDFLNSGRSGFTNVITTNRDRVPVGYFAGTEREDVGH